MQTSMSAARTLITGVQMLFVAFGALVLVPLLTGLDPSVALFTAGAGTLLFQLITRRNLPVFLASSFAYIAPIIFAKETYGLSATLGGLMAAGMVQVVFALLVRYKGDHFIHRYLPPVVIGPTIMLIGLILAPVAINMAKGLTGDGAAVLVPFEKAIVIAIVSLAATVIVTLWGRGMLRLIPILVGILCGYGLSIVMGVVDFGAVQQADWVRMPGFVAPTFDLGAILYMIPIALAPTIEHVGDVMAISRITGKNYLLKPGLKNTLMGDGAATMLAASLGGPPNTTYSEVSGAVALIRVFDASLMTIAAIAAIVLAFVGKLGAILQTIPVPVMGGIMILLFGMITSIGIGTLVKAQTDMSNSRNLIIVAVVLVMGIGGMSIDIGNFHLGGIGLAGLVGVILNLLLPEHLGENEEEQA